MLDRKGHQQILHSEIIDEATLLLLCVKRTVCWFRYNKRCHTQLQLQLFCRSLADMVLSERDDRKRGGKGMAARGADRLAGTEMMEGVSLSEP